MYYLEGIKAWVNSAQSFEPRRILAPTWDLNQRSPGPQSRVVTTILPLHTVSLKLSLKRVMFWASKFWTLTKIYLSFFISDVVKAKIPGPSKPRRKLDLEDHSGFTVLHLYLFIFNESPTSRCRKIQIVSLSGIVAQSVKCLSWTILKKQCEIVLHPSCSSADGK